MSPHLHLLRSQPGERPVRSMCGRREVFATIMIDECDCDDCLIVEGFRSTDPAVCAVQNARAAELKAIWSVLGLTP